MSSSLGNPYFNNKTKTVEPHLLHEFSDDFYGSEIRLVITGYLRPEANFDDLGAQLWLQLLRRPFRFLDALFDFVQRLVPCFPVWWVRIFTSDLCAVSW